MVKHEKYRVLRKIDSGGMAEVFQGVAESIEGFSKKVAIKRVLPHLVENSKFIAMFLDEAKLSLRMTHANVVHVFDIGQAGGTYFIVMEFVDGINLKKLLAHLKETSDRLPVEQSVYIAMEICRGLAYAHDLTDADNDNLGIVHRDVSPPNILLSKEGEVKIVDFGLAKATSQLEHTDPGIVKGKFAYLSPEAAWGKKVDKRADIFSLGIVLFEMLTGQRLFLGENDVQTVELVRLGDVPSMAQINPDIAIELEQIIHKALSQNADDRYQTCDEMAEDLANYLFASQRKVTSFDIRRTISEITSNENKKNASKPSIIDLLIQDEIGIFASLETEKLTKDSSISRAVSVATGEEPLNPFGFEDDSNQAQLPNESSLKASGLLIKEKKTSKLASLNQNEGSEISLAQMLEGEVCVLEEASLEKKDSKKSIIIGFGVALIVVTISVVIVINILKLIS